MSVNQVVPFDVKFQSEQMCELGRMVLGIIFSDGEVRGMVFPKRKTSDPKIIYGVCTNEEVSVYRIAEALKLCGFHVKRKRNGWWTHTESDL